MNLARLDGIAEGDACLGPLGGGGHAPQVDAAVVAGRCQGSPVVAEGQGRDPRGVIGQDRFLPGDVDGGVPELDGFIGGARGQRLAVGRVSDGLDGLFVGLHQHGVLGRLDGGVEDADLVVEAGDGDGLAVGIEGNAVDVGGARGSGETGLQGLLAAGHVIKGQRAISTANGQHLAVLAEGHAGGVAERYQLEQAHVAGPPDPDIEASPTGDHTAIGAEGDAGDGGSVPAAMLAQDGHQVLGLPGELLHLGDLLGVKAIESGRQLPEEVAGALGDRSAG